MIPLLLNLERLINGSTNIEIIHAIWRPNNKIDCQKVYMFFFSLLGVVVFTSMLIGVATQNRFKSTFFLMKVHCMAHHTNNLAMQIFNYD
jgi:hypothetical protein